MKLNALLENVAAEKITGNLAQDVSAVVDDSRKVVPGCLFVAIPGTKIDATRFVGEAVAGGAAVVVCEKLPPSPPPHRLLGGPAVLVLVKNARLALAQIAANYYGHPSHRMKIIAVTGTNGKTTVTYLVEEILRRAGYRVGVIGTIGSRIGKKVIAEGLTTPPPIELQRILRKMADRKVQYVILEASSHAMAQERLSSVELDAAVFTNLTPEHLDYHRSMQKYLASKQKLFQLLEKSSKNTCAVVNFDDRFARRVTKGYTGKILTYGVNKASNFRAQNVKVTANAIDFRVKQNVFYSNLPGKYNVYNLLAAALTGLALGVDVRIIQAALQEIKTIPGRMEEILPGGVPIKAGFRAFVDFAHTPDGLMQALGAARMKVKRGRKLILVFGCPGDRDRAKRPVMAAIAQKLANYTIVTTDDPHSEDSAKIIGEILLGWNGLKNKKPVARLKKNPDRVRQADERLFAVVDRRAAIEKALSLAKAGDVVLAAGRGHEKFQDFNGRKVALDDREAIESFLSRKPA